MLYQVRLKKIFILTDFTNRFLESITHFLFGSRFACSVMSIANVAFKFLPTNFIFDQVLGRKLTKNRNKIVTKEILEVSCYKDCCDLH